MYEIPYTSHDLSRYKFLVTGGGGFIGSHIVEYLVKHNAGEVRILDNFITGRKENIAAFIGHPSVKLIEGSIVDLETCMAASENIDFISHQAALGSVPRSIDNPIATNENNITGFLNMLNSARLNKVKRFVYASSSSVYGDSQVLPKQEDQTGNPLSPYAVTKKVNELYASVFRKVYQMEIVGLRYFNIFGPRQNPKGEYAAAIPLFIDAYLNQYSPVIFGDGKQTRDFTFVANAVQANIKAMLADQVSSEVFNIASGERLSLLDVLDAVSGFTGYQLPISFKEQRKGDVRDSLADISRAMNELDYSPKVTSKQGLKITFDWFKQESNGVLQ